jgi:ribonuclease E
MSEPADDAAPEVPADATDGVASSTPTRSRGRGAVGEPSPEPSDNGTTPGAGGSAGTKRRRGSRGGRNRSRPAGETGADGTESTDGGEAQDDRPSRGVSGGTVGSEPLPGTPPRPKGTARSRMPDELPERIIQGRPKSADVAERALVKRPQIGDSRPAPAPVPAGDAAGDADPAPAKKSSRRGSGASKGSPKGRDERDGKGGRGGRSGSSGGGSGGTGGAGTGSRRRKSAGESKSRVVKPVEAALPTEAIDLDEKTLDSRRGRERKGRPVGRYLMAVSVGPKATQIAVLEGRNLIEHYVSRPADDIFQIHGNIYLGRVQNVLPGMEAAFVDIGTPKNAVLYRGDVQYDAEDIEEGGNLRIEQMLKAKQNIVCQVTKNPIGHKGARLTQEVSLPGRFVVLIPNSKTYGISKRLSDDERKRLRQILDRVKPSHHGIIVRTAAENVTAEEIERDVTQLLQQWEQIEQLIKTVKAPALLYREPDMAVRVIREEFNKDYRGIILDDPTLHEEVRSYVAAISPTLADRVQLHDRSTEPLSIFERYHVHEQLHKALDRKVWLPSGGSLIIEHTEALTVIDVNTGKNVGSSNLEDTVFKNNLEAADEIAKQLRLRDIGGIIVCDFIDMEIEANRRAVIKAFRNALARDKTRTQVFDISELGLVEMTRKRIGEGLLESFSGLCPECEGRGVLIDQSLLD